LAGEQYCSAFHATYGLETVVLRYFNVFGPRQDPNSQYAAAVPQFIAAALQGEPPTIYGDGNQTRDFVYVANVVHANVLAAGARPQTPRRSTRRHAVQQFAQLVQAEGLPQYRSVGALQRVAGLGRNGVTRREDDALLAPLSFRPQLIEQVEPRMRFVQVHVHQ